MKWSKMLVLSMISSLLLVLCACNMNQTGERLGDNNNNVRQNGQMNQDGTLERARNFNESRRNQLFGANRTDLRPWDNSFENGRNGRNGRQDGMMNRQEITRMEASDEAADAIAKLNGVEAASVMLTNRNAYVAVMLENNDSEVSDQIKERIAKTVRRMDPNIRNVFVSANPDFMDRMNGIIEEMGNGQPVRGMIREFNTMVERMFPENK